MDERTGKMKTAAKRSTIYFASCNLKDMYIHTMLIRLGNDSCSRIAINSHIFCILINSSYIYVMSIWEYCSNKYDLIIGNKNCTSILQRKTQTTVILRYSLLVSWSKMVMKTICNEIIYRSIEIEESLGKYQRAARRMSSFK